MHAQARPWADFVVMQIRGGGAADGRLRHSARPAFRRPARARSSSIFELLYEFVKGQAEDQVGHAAHRYLAVLRHDFSVYPDLAT